MTFSLYGLTDFEVQYWDGSNWTDVPGGNVTSNNLIWRQFTFPALTTSKIRVLVSNAPNGYSRITEVEAYGVDASARTNVALSTNGASASGSSVLGSGWAASGAINGDRKGTNWGTSGGWADGTSNTFPDSLEVDFSASQTISEVDVFGLQDSYSSPAEPTETMTFSNYGLTSFEVQYWTGSAWTDIPNGNVTSNNLIWRKFTFIPITTSKIRVVVNDAPNGYSRITEVEAYQAESLNYVLSDVQGSARAVMDNSGSGTSSIVSRHDYLPFGEEISSGTGTRTTAQGYGMTDSIRQKYGLTERDVTGLDHTLFRKYESLSGRMTSPDPYGGSMSINNPQSFNRYSYVQNDPMNFVDPSGLKPNECGAGTVPMLVDGSVQCVGVGTNTVTVYSGYDPISNAFGADNGNSGWGGDGFGSLLLHPLREPLNPELNRDIRKAVNLALDKLTGECAKYIAGNSGLNPADVLRDMRDDRQNQRFPFLGTFTEQDGTLNNNIIAHTYGGVVNGGPPTGGVIGLYMPFFSDNLAQGIPLNPGGQLPSGFDSDMARALVILHELKHILDTGHPTGAFNFFFNLSLAPEPNSNRDFNSNILKKCF